MLFQAFIAERRSINPTVFPKKKSPENRGFFISLDSA